VSDLPHVDTITLDVAAPPDRVWEVLVPWARSAGVPPRFAVLGRLWGMDPPSGFAVTGEVPGERVVLGGRHRFAVYRLVLAVGVGAHGSTLSAITLARFPGLRGAAYRVLVIRTGLHVLATRAMLRTIARRATG
jgi:hypothetical protein